MATFIKHLHIAEKIAFVDGFWGTGKSMLGPVLGSFKNVEKQRLEQIYEYLCLLYRFEKIDTDAAITMMRLYADLAIYNSMISREVNLRVFDDSGLLNNPDKMKYIVRLFYRDGDIVLERIQKSKPILQIMTHIVLPIIDLAFRAFGDRLRVIEIVRHPLYLIENWYNYIDRCGKDPREFTLWVDFKGEALPWFAYGWEEKYLESNSMDKVIYSIQWLTHKADEALGTLSKGQREQILIIPFERFVLDPWPFVDAIGASLSTEPTAATKRVLRRQGCPRELVAAGPAKEIYKRYGWKKPKTRTTESAELRKRREFAESLASREALNTLDTLCAEYENRYGLWF